LGPGFGAGNPPPDLFLEAGRQRGVNGPLTQSFVQSFVILRLVIWFHTAKDSIMLSPGFAGDNGLGTPDSG
jgi:hypothetical protein